MDNSRAARLTIAAAERRLVSTLFGGNTFMEW